MKTKFFILISIFLSQNLFASAQNRLTLKKCFELALKQSEIIATSDESVKKAEAQYRSVIGKSLPELSFRYSSTWQDQSGLDTSLSSFTKSPQPSAEFRMKLPIFSGYRELAAIRAGSSFVKQRENEKRHAELLLFMDVAKSYYSAILAEKNLSTVRKALKLALDREKEIVERERLGRSRKAETLDMKAKVATLKVQEQDAKFTYDTAKNLLEFLMGTPVEEELEDTAMIKQPETLEHYLAVIDNRPDIEAKRAAEKTAEGALRVAKALHLPQADMNANYYVDRSGYKDPIDWDVTLGVTVPLWAWGATQGHVREAGSSAKQAKLDKELAIRLATIEIKDIYNKYSSSLKKAELQEKALKLMQQSYLTRIDEYRHGLVNNLEVLDSLDRFYQAEIGFNAARFSSALDYLTLETSKGSMPEGFE